MDAYYIGFPSAGKNSAYKEMKQLLEAKHITVLPEEFYCKGKFLMAHRKHPDENDVEMGKKFALAVMRKVESNI
ncbi:MAG TPA: hypothetical protein VHQ24_17045 [Lachnospiraceae bacterium]|nr:hypothetical protein [Lachnospiraceae bacterium]